ncbi:MAG: hypothetical protein B7Z83_08830, partial [Thiomonas sp. 20-64-5]
MISIFFLWFAQTSIMPLFVGMLTGALAPWAWGKGCGLSSTRRALRAGIAAWIAHLALVGGGIVREGSIVDYAAVVLMSAMASELSCRWC